MPRKKVDHHPGTEWYCNTEELAEMLGISPKTIYGRVKRGKLEYQLKIENRVYFSESYVAQTFREEQEKWITPCNKFMCVHRADCLKKKKFLNNPNGCDEYERYTMEHRIRGIA
jgi:predicted DNA-binding transcriptional regulator AlpA